MARPRNDELKEKIEAAAWKLFRDVGYDAASYSAIAEACNISRNLVQYHFPKKELLAIRLMERVLTAAQEALGLSDETLRGDLAAMHAVGSCYFAFFLQDEGHRVFLLDIIRSRDLTESVLAFNANWALEHAGAPASAMRNDATLHAVIVHMGGFYELLYWCLKNERHFDPARELEPVIQAFAQSLGRDGESSAVSESLVFPQRIEQAARAMDAALIGQMA